MSKWCPFPMFFFFQTFEFPFLLSASLALTKINLKLPFVVKFEFKMPSPVPWGSSHWEAGGLVFSQTWLIPCSLYGMILATSLSPAHFHSKAPPALQLFHNVFLINMGPARAHKGHLSLCCSFSWVFRIKLLLEFQPSWGRDYLPFSERIKVNQ